MLLSQGDISKGILALSGNAWGSNFEQGSMTWNQILFEELEVRIDGAGVGKKDQEGQEMRMDGPGE